MKHILAPFSTSHFTVSPELLAQMDEARDYDAASSWNWLNAELKRQLQVVQNGGTVHIVLASGPLVLNKQGDFLNWVRQRYASAEICK